MTEKIHTMSAGCHDTIEKVKLLLHDAPLSMLRHIVRYTSNRIVDLERANAHKTEAPKQVDDLFVYVPNFLKSNSNTLDISTDFKHSEAIEINETDLLKELKSLNLEEKATTSGAPDKVQTQWILKNPELNNLPSPRALNEFPAIGKLCDLINQFESTKGTMNGCLVNLYPTGAANLSPHSDNESYVDQESSICTLSLSSKSRNIQILPKKHSDNRPLKTYLLENGSLFIMQPGSQYCTRHRVLGHRSNNEDDAQRFSISFRNILPSSATNEWPHNRKSNATTHMQPKPQPLDLSLSQTLDEQLTQFVNQSQSSTEYSPDTTIILGDSISRDLHSDRLAGNSKKRQVINLSDGGAKISDASKTLDDFYTNGSEKHPHTESTSVKTVIICLGTNDIRHCQGKVNHLFFPFSQLIDKIRSYYPNAVIYLQSLLPQKIAHKHVVDNVLNFLHVLQDLCNSKHVYYIDVFDKFLNSNEYPNTSLFKPDGIHPNYYGRKILAREFINRIRGKFDYRAIPI